MIITIDGPAASGKSTIALLLAKQTGSFYINSGLLFRAVAFSALEYDKSSILQDEKALFSFVCSELEYTFTPNTGPLVRYNNKDITPFLKSPEVSSYASVIATNHNVRKVLLEYQRILADSCQVIADGRDCGTVVFPQAPYKFFITASKEIRAQRLQKDLAQKDQYLPLDQIVSLINERDIRDSERSEAPLQIPENAHVIDNSLLSVQETLTLILSYLPSDILKKDS